jgi:hypothetical protein
MVVRFFGGLIVVLVLLVGCSSTPVSPVYDDAGLLAAEEEIAELKAQLEEQTKSSDEPTVSVPATEATEIFETLTLPTTGLSEGPCGVFTLNGTRILQLEYDHVDGPYQWVDSGVDYIQMLLGNMGERLAGMAWHERPPDVAFAVRVAENRNEFFGFSWGSSWALLPELADVGVHREISGIRGASVNTLGGFFGLDENCEWDWVSITSGGGTHDSGQKSVGNSTFSFEYRYPHVWLTEFRWKDYSCEKAPPPGSIATYDPKKHMFISKCKDGS